MKNIQLTALCLFLTLGSFFSLIAQHSEGGNFTPTGPCLTEVERDNIKALIEENRNALGLKPNNASEKTVVDDLTFPLQIVDTPPGYFNYYAVSNYVDHVNTIAIQDYNCSSTTYNGHRGTDYFTFPFWWYLYENDLVEVIAAAPGTIVLKQDGNPDTNCIPAGQWNAVYVQHADGSIVWYGHMKAGSLTEKLLGQTVEQGEYLGVVASSGNSNGPHLHLEYYSESGALQDPYTGQCNLLNDNSLWLNQPAYARPQVNAVLTHGSVPSIGCTVQDEFADLKNVFYPDDQITAGVYLTDYVAGTTATTRIFRPDNSLSGAFDSSSGTSYQWFRNSASTVLPASEMPGTWRVETEYMGETYIHEFEFINGMTSTDDHYASSYRIYPNPASDQLLVEWNDSTSATFLLYDQHGRLLWQGQTSSNTQESVDVSDFSAGLYFLQLRTKEGSSVRKVIVE